MFGKVRGTSVGRGVQDADSVKDYEGNRRWSVFEGVSVPKGY